MKISREDFLEMVKDIKWNQLILHKMDGTIWIDLEKYSAGKVYLPIGKGYDAYTKGFLLTQKLYEDRYRTNDNLVELELERESHQFNACGKEINPG